MRTVGDMPDSPEPERMSIRDVRSDFSATLNRVGVRGHVIILTSYGQDMAALVPLAVLEQAQQTQEEGRRG